VAGGALHGQLKAGQGLDVRFVDLALSASKSHFGAIKLGSVCRPRLFNGLVHRGTTLRAAPAVHIRAPLSAPTAWFPLASVFARRFSMAPLR